MDIYDAVMEEFESFVYSYGDHSVLVAVYISVLVLLPQLFLILLQRSGVLVFVPSMVLKWSRISSVRLELTIVTSPGVWLSDAVTYMVHFPRFNLV